MASLYRRRCAREEIGLGTRLIGLVVLANAETVVLAAGARSTSGTGWVSLRSR
ncbi:MAG TPA: hypothetical protein VN544_10205 [Gaiellaceae bacterium]|nr:hypothetical protein [Gaiellaceae bacterium]